MRSTKKTRDLVKRLAKEERRTVYGMIGEMAIFYKEWRDKMELVISKK